MDTIDIAMLVMFIVIVVVVAVMALQRQKAREAMLASMTPEERALYDAENEYKRAVKQAEYALRSASSDWQSRVNAAQRQLAKAKKSGQRRLAAYSGNKASACVWQHQIKVPGGMFPMTGDVTAAVDTAGNLAVDRRATLTRMAAGGLVAGPVGILAGGLLKKKEMHDTRELYLLIEGPGFGALIDCKPDEGQKVREFAAAVNGAARAADSVRATREQAMGDVAARLAAIQADRGTIEAAERALAAVRADTGKIEVARAQIDSAKSLSPGQPVAGE